MGILSFGSKRFVLVGGGVAVSRRKEKSQAGQGWNRHGPTLLLLFPLSRLATPAALDAPGEGVVVSCQSWQSLLSPAPIPKEATANLNAAVALTLLQTLDDKHRRAPRAGQSLSGPAQIRCVKSYPTSRIGRAEPGGSCLAERRGDEGSVRASRSSATQRWLRNSRRELCSDPSVSRYQTSKLAACHMRSECGVI